ncbi:hypothetical protein CMsap09_09200 [Clavibacter michiganensis]|uniref:Uncharacterized protein n=1 Tax=Clavibacter michiganensis TaxID=28447 RepID=A0A251XVC2_9MICO|nr:hypothetical protein CMsap09_09200 [Clavibacter michiganensis]
MAGGGGSGDDGSTLTITGGTLVVDAEGDGLDSNGSATISGGTVVVNGPEGSGNGALDVNGTLDVSAGTLLAAGSSGMVVSPATTSTQGWISATLDSTYDAGTTVQILDADGTVVASFEASKSFGNIVYSSDAITTGESYSVAIGGTVSGASTGGLAASGDATGAAASVTVTAGEAATGGMGGR